jgi:hypothetical protein
VNTILNSLTFRPVLYYRGAAKLTLTTTDLTSLMFTSSLINLQVV